jgi:arabinosyltransferase C
VWGSYPRLGGEDNTGRLTTDWYQLPSRDGGDRLLVDGSGKFGGGNDLVAEYGQRRGSDVVPVGRQSLDDHIDSPDWRQVGLDVPADAGADAVRLVATDATGGPGGWLAVTAPFAAQPRLLAEQIPASDTVGVSWQFSFLFPCANQPETVDGITQPSSYLIAWGDTGLRGLDDNIYSRARGGLFHPTIRSSSLVKLDAAMVGHPEVKLLQVYAVTNPYPADGYDLATGRTTRWGWQGP